MYLQNDTAAALRKIQEYLYEIYLFEDIASPPPIDGIYGNETQAAILLFQKRFGLEESGAVDLRTFENLRDMALRYKKANEKCDRLINADRLPLRIGASGSDIEILHALLRSLAAYDPEMPPIPRAAYFSSETQNAVRYLQRIFKQEESGCLDSATLDRLQNELYARKAFI